MLQTLPDDANTSPGQTIYLDGAAMNETCFCLAPEPMNSSSQGNGVSAGLPWLYCPAAPSVYRFL